MIDKKLLDLVIRDIEEITDLKEKIEKIIMNLLDFGAKLGHLFRNPLEDKEIGTKFCLYEVYLYLRKLWESSYLI